MVLRIIPLLLLCNKTYQYTERIKIRIDTEY